MKWCVLLLLLMVSNVGFSSEPINDLKRLKETVNSISAFMMTADNSPPASFMATKDEFRVVLLNTDRDATEQAVEDGFRRFNQKVTSRYERLKKDVGEIKGMISFDTITYIRESAKSIDVSIELTVVDRWTKTDRTTRVLLSFLIINNQLKFAPSLRDISFFHYTLHELEMVNSTMRRAFGKRYPNHLQTSVGNIIPFEKKGKLGLMTLKNEILLEPVYDSISPFVGDYARVRIKGRYNLIDKNYKTVFPKAKQQIKLEGSYYRVIDAGKSSVYPPSAEVEEVVMLDEPVTEEVTQRTYQKDPASQLREELSNTHYKRNYEVKRLSDQSNAPTTHSIIQTSDGAVLSTFQGFEFIDPHGDFLCGRRNDSTFVMTPSGKVVFKSQYVCKYESPGYVQIFDRTTRFFGLYCPYTNVYIKPIYAYIEAIDRDRFFVVLTKKGKFGYLNAVGKELF